ncbi:MAG: hypothetical protein ACK4L4_20365, partial [Gemmobacter sp.]
LDKSWGQRQRVSLSKDRNETGAGHSAYGQAGGQVKLVKNGDIVRSALPSGIDSVLAQQNEC